MKTYKAAVLSQHLLQSMTSLTEREGGFLIFLSSEYAEL